MYSNDTRSFAVRLSLSDELLSDSRSDWMDEFE
eukprot:CAMPEP_0205921770 /NCGR_PEP_ID=MMETSP1325-20131115/13411_1 /ASSEMBLY_ACC=CAM_ASM_000708 /TAXON_ID=236786 /ORGANISM="Florenciella sp., Strain RCC1007" /LENGTH=32 /DNA_ID= /DNA_START= /DNA_END= /DNA_ORIENTATION=